MFKRSLLIVFVLSALIAALCLTVHSEEAVKAPGGEVSSTDGLFAALGGEASAVKKDGAILLLSDIVLEKPITLLKGEYKLLGGGCTVSAEFTDSSFITVGDGTSETVLTIGDEKDKKADENIIFDANGDEIKGSFISVSEKSELAVYAGTLFQNAASSLHGAAISNSGAFTFYGGSVTDLICDGAGGAFYNLGTMMLAGGDISNCKADFGGAIYNEGELYLIGTELIGCDAEKGGAVYNMGKLSLVSSPIYKCSANVGGALYIAEDADAELIGGSITDSSASVNGGGVYNCGKMTIGSEKNGDSIGTSFEKNKAPYGGNIFNESAELTIYGGSVYSGTADKNGGNILNADTGRTVIKGGSVSDGKAQYGGGIFNLGELVISGGGFFTNKAEVGSAILNDGKLIFNEFPYISDKNDVFITVKPSSASAAIIESEMKAECVALLTPGINDGGEYTVKYNDGDVLIVGDYAETSYERFKISSDDGDDWLLSSEGALKRKLPIYYSPIFYILLVAAFAVTVTLMVAFMLLVDKHRMKKKTA